MKSIEKDKSKVSLVEKQRFEESVENNDPFVYFREKPKEQYPHPSYFNPIELKNFYEKPVPIIFQRYTVVPDSLLIAFTMFNLDRVSMLIMLLLHKNTLGFLNNTSTEKYKSDRVIRTEKMPANSIVFQYGPKYNEKQLKRRCRLIKTTIRDIAYSINASKSTVHRKIKYLEKLKLIQVDSNKHSGTIIGINYLTLESLCGGKSVAYQLNSPKRDKNNKQEEPFTTIKDELQRNIDCGFVTTDNNNRFVENVNLSIENVVKLLSDNKEDNLQNYTKHPIMQMLGRVFFNNHFLQKLLNIYSPPHESLIYI